MARIHGRPPDPQNDIVDHRAEVTVFLNGNANGLLGGEKKAGKERNYFLVNLCRPNVRLYSSLYLTPTARERTRRI
jgi:hypothetical protein